MKIFWTVLCTVVLTANLWSIFYHDGNVWNWVASGVLVLAALFHLFLPKQKEIHVHIEIKKKGGEGPPLGPVG